MLALLIEFFPYMMIEGRLIVDLLWFPQIKLDLLIFPDNFKNIDWGYSYVRAICLLGRNINQIYSVSKGRKSRQSTKSLNFILCTHARIFSLFIPLLILAMPLTESSCIHKRALVIFVLISILFKMPIRYSWLMDSHENLSLLVPY